MRDFEEISVLLQWGRYFFERWLTNVYCYAIMRLTQVNWTKNTEGSRKWQSKLFYPMVSGS